MSLKVSSAEIVVRKSILLFLFISIPLYIVSFHPNVIASSSGHELLSSIAPGKAKKLVDYNSRFLKEQLYDASNYRIVKTNIGALRQTNPITLTLFPSSQPIVLEHIETIEDENNIIWEGQIDLGDLNEMPADQRSMIRNNFRVKVFAHAFDLDSKNEATLPATNQFRHSEHWEIDAAGTPILAPPKHRNETFIAGPPPQTYEEIVEHKRLKALNRRAFFSARILRFSVVDSDTGTFKQYELIPLKYTPKYSVLKEIDNTKQLTAITDLQPGQLDPRTPSQLRKIQDCEKFIDSLPREPSKRVLGDIE